MRFLPRGRSLPEEVWWQRHRGILILLWLHVPALFAMAMNQGESPAHAAFEVGGVAALATLATVARSHPALSTVITSVGLMTCSAELVHLSGGLIEMHFHFFVVVGLVTLYQDWRPFLVAIGYVVLHHGIAGALDPAAVYNHPAAIASPWKWAAVHGAFILAMSTVGIVTWKLNEFLISAVSDSEHRLADAQEIAMVGSWENRAELGSATWSAEMYRLLGVDDRFPTEPESVLSLVHPDHQAAWRADMDRAEAGGVHDLDYRIVTPDGTVRWLHGRAEVTSWHDGTPAVMTGTIQDITDRKRTEAELQSSTEATQRALSMLEATLDSTADGILAVDLDGHVSGYNDRFAEMWRLPAELHVGDDDSAVMASVLDQVSDPLGFVADVTELYGHVDAESFDVVRFEDGRVFERCSLPQRVGGEIVGRVWSFHDVSDRARLEQELAYQAFHDALTGLANQTLFHDRVEHALARVRRGAAGDLAVLFIDLDNFKHVNDSLGHAAGDRLLVDVTKRLAGQLRPADTAARMGGDEFAILLEDLDDLDHAGEIAERLLRALQAPFQIAGQEVFTTASIGIASPTGVDGCEQLLRDADLAMYTAKRLGKGRAERFRPGMHVAAMERIELEGDLRRARERNELRLEYQPIVSLATGALVSVEALVRWQHPVRGLLSPGAFIHYAEESGLIDDIGMWVLEEACGQACEWQDRHPSRSPVGINVNLSPRQLRNATLITAVSQILADTGLDPALLTLEITENAMMQNTDLALSRLRDLKALGIQLAIDDFGTGYSSLSYLQQFPIDVIKIDRSFIHGSEGGRKESSLARAIIGLAQTLNLVAVVEGVENDAQIDWLRHTGCTSAQGFHLSRPVKADAILAMLAPPFRFEVRGAQTGNLVLGR